MNLWIWPTIAFGSKCKIVILLSIIVSINDSTHACNLKAFSLMAFTTRLCGLCACNFMAFNSRKELHRRVINAIICMPVTWWCLQHVSEVFFVAHLWPHSPTYVLGPYNDVVNVTGCTWSLRWCGWRDKFVLDPFNDVVNVISLN